jgi:hypothetical protein
MLNYLPTQPNVVVTEYDIRACLLKFGAISFLPFFFSYEELEQQHKYSSNMQFEGYQRPPNSEYSLNSEFKLSMKMYWFLSSISCSS